MSNFYFTNAHRTLAMRRGQRIFYPRTPPPNPNSDSNAWPGNVFLTRRLQNAANSTVPDTEIYHNLWATRAHIYSNTEANNITPPILLDGGKRGEVEYTTVQKAITATIVQVRDTLGHSLSDLQAEAVAGGFNAEDVVEWSWLDANKETVFTIPGTNGDPEVMVCYDLIWRAAEKLTLVSDGRRKGVCFDYEPGDGSLTGSPAGARTTAQTTDLFTTCKTLCAAEGLLFGVFSNNFADNKKIGIDASNAYAISTILDWWAIVVDASNGSLLDDWLAAEEIIRAGGPVNYAKVFPAVDMAVTDLRQFLALKHYLDVKGCRNIWLWPHLQEEGADPDLPYNRKVSVLCLGRGAWRTQAAAFGF